MFLPDPVTFHRSESRCVYAADTGADVADGGLIFSVFVLCVLSLCSVFCVLLGANMATNVGCPQCTVGHPEVQMLGAIVS